MASNVNVRGQAKLKSEVVTKVTKGQSVTVIEEENLVENSARVGAWILSRFREMAERHELIGHVQGKGLAIGVELVKDRVSKEPLDKKVCVRIFHECLRRGLVSMVYNPHFRVNPALTKRR